MSRCFDCPGVNTCVEPDGPVSTGGILFCGEAPGAVEDKHRIPFVGKTGEEVNRHYLPLAGLRREDVLFTNAIRCLPVSTGGKLDPNRRTDLDLLTSCSRHHLYPLVQRMKPRLIVAMGSFACKAFDPDIQLDLQHGFPVQTPYGMVMPFYHPASGLHEPKKILHLRNDWIRLRQYLGRKLVIPVDDYPHPDYAEVTDVHEIAELDPTTPLAGDTEITRKREPYCLTYSQQPGTGRLIRASRPDLLRAFQRKLDRWESHILFHNWLFDKPVTEAMALRIPSRHIVDTMVLTYHLGNLPQGLKALSKRELGMTMQDFDDVVRPYSAIRVRDYFINAYLNPYPWMKPDAELIRDPEGLWKVYQAQGLATKLKRTFNSIEKEPDKDLFDIWDNWEMHWDELEAIAGEYPGLCISHVPFDKALHYACRDADAVLRLYPLLLRMRRNVRRLPQEKWRQ